MSVATSVTMVCVGPAAAAAPSDPIESTAALIAEVAPDQGAILPGATTPTGIEAFVGDKSVAIPTNPEAAISFTAPDLVAPIEVNLPSELDVDHGAVAGDGTVVYESTNGGAGAAVQVLSDGSARLQTITPDASAAHEFTYTFGDGVQPVVAEDGSVELIADTDMSALKVVLGTIDEPWAVGADGEPVATEYRVEGASLVQAIAADEGTSYPVVADPRLTAGVGIYLYLNKVEASTIVGGSSAIAAAGAGASCAIYGKRVAGIPGVSLVVNKLCGYVSASALFTFFTVSLPALVKSVPACTEMRYLTGWTSKSVSASLCTPLSRSMQWT